MLTVSGIRLGPHDIDVTPLKSTSKVAHGERFPESDIGETHFGLRPNVCEVGYQTLSPLDMCTMWLGFWGRNDPQNRVGVAHSFGATIIRRCVVDNGAPESGSERPHRSRVSFYAFV